MLLECSTLHGKRHGCMRSNAGVLRLIQVMATMPAQQDSKQ